MQTMIKLLVAVLFFISTIAPVTGQARLVHNTLEEIEACKGKLELQLIRTWGGEDEEDEHKFFITPGDMVINNENRVFICDRSSNCIKVFDETGKYLRTIGQRGQGPGDLLAPFALSFHPKSGLWVSELMGWRIQCFDTNGKSKAIFKTKNFVSWIGVNSKNEIAVHSKSTTVNSKRLLTVRSETWELKREIGVYHDKSKSTSTAETIIFSIDSEDNFIASNVKTPVIRKYSSEGKLLTAITFETPYKIPVKVTLNAKGDEIKRTGKFEEQTVKVIRKGSSVTIRSDKTHRKPSVCTALTTDSQNRIYIITKKRQLTDEERKGGSIRTTGEKILRSKMNYDVLENKDINRLLVFTPEGKIIALVKASPFFPKLYIHGDRIFFIDGLLNQRIREYKMTFKTGTP